MAKYDYLIVGAGLFGAVFAQQAKKAGKQVLVIDKRPNIAGNVYTGIRQPFCSIQPLYQFACGKLSRRALLPAL